jgi:hypothetical protein
LWSEFRLKEIRDPPDVKSLLDIRDALKANVLSLLSNIKNNQKKIYVQRRKVQKFKSQFHKDVEKNVRRRQILDQQTIFFDIPGKMPEAYSKAFVEFERRKVFELASSFVL